MGSLPNLHELGRQSPSSPPPPPSIPTALHHRHTGPALGHLCGGPVCSPTKAKILQRYAPHPRITKARSNGHDTTKIIFDDFMLEHMAAYSPISTRHHATQRRRDSLSSSIGATSVRRLIGVVRPHTNHGPITRHTAPTYTRRLLISNLTVFCLSHLLVTAALLPFIVLQSSISAWTPNAQYDVGSWLLGLTHLVAALTSLIGPSCVRKLGTNLVLITAYVISTLYYTTHLYPSYWLIIPVAIIFGMAMGPLASARTTFLMTLASKLCLLYGDDEEDAKLARRVCIIRRMARAFQAAHDFGLILGSICTTIIITYPINYGVKNETNVIDLDYYVNGTGVPSTEPYLDRLFDTMDGRRLCGAQACPTFLGMSSGNVTDDGDVHVLPHFVAIILTSVYGGLCLVAIICAVGLDRIRTYVHQDPLERPEGLAALRAVQESFKDTKLQLAAPLAFFIGVEQAFIFADFSKSYVVCTFGVQRLNMIFLSMGLLQSIAACTLSMLLRTIRRYYVVAVGFTFHACLFMVLILWKPIEDDPALFYVISASWGVCNAIWEMLNFTLLTGLFADNWEAAFANRTFFLYLGRSVAFGLHAILCNHLKLYGTGLLMLLAVIPFAYLEIRLENMRRVKHLIRL